VIGFAIIVEKLILHTELNVLIVTQQLEKTEKMSEQIGSVMNVNKLTLQDALFVIVVMPQNQTRRYALKIGPVKIATQLTLQDVLFAIVVKSRDKQQPLQLLQNHYRKQ